MHMADSKPCENMCRVDLGGMCTLMCTCSPAVYTRHMDNGKPCHKMCRVDYGGLCTLTCTC